MATIRKTNEKKEKKTSIIANKEKPPQKNKNKNEILDSKIVEKEKGTTKRKQTTENDSVKTEKIKKTASTKTIFKK